jgi:ABC-type uncharacterized transport system permease subunit
VTWPRLLGAASTVLRPTEAANAFAAQCIWVAVACLVGRVLMAAGRHKLVVQGG